MRPLTLADITTKDSERWCENVALYRQVCSGNPPDLRCLREWSGCAFPNIKNGGFNYLNFPDDEWVAGSRKVKLNNFKKYPWLYLEPSIFEHLLRQIRDQRLEYRSRLEDRSDSIVSWFDFDIADPLLVKGLGQINYNELAKLYRTIPSTLMADTNNNHDKDQLQRKEVTLLRGEELTGAVVHGRQHKATVTVGHLSYKVCP